MGHPNDKYGLMDKFHYHEESLIVPANERNDFMRQIGFIPDPVDAKKFEDYLYTQGTLVRIDRHNAGYNVWVFDEDKQIFGKQELLQYLENPQSKIYSDAVLIAKNQRIKQEKDDSATPEYKVVFSDQVVQFPRITFLLAICILAVSVPMLFDDEKKNEHGPNVWLGSTGTERGDGPFFKSGFFHAALAIGNPGFLALWPPSSAFQSYAVV